uniref:Uncharacterized protein n=1 Tax=Fagus sylvatica TaxID=28930 RepID=A0A2N9H821_FAGSY
MEYGGGRKRWRPEAALNGNGGFKKSKQGSVAEFEESNCKVLNLKFRLVAEKLFAE